MALPQFTYNITIGDGWKYVASTTYETLPDFFDLQGEEVGEAIATLEHYMEQLHEDIASDISKGNYGEYVEEGMKTQLALLNDMRFLNNR